MENCIQYSYVEPFFKSSENYSQRLSSHSLEVGEETSQCYVNWYRIRESPAAPVTAINIGRDHEPGLDRRDILPPIIFADELCQFSILITILSLR